MAAWWSGQLAVLIPLLQRPFHLPKGVSPFCHLSHSPSLVPPKCSSTYFCPIMMLRHQFLYKMSFKLGYKLLLSTPTGHSGWQICLPASLPLSILPTPGHIKSKRLSCAQNHRLWCAWGPKGLSVYQISSEREGESVCACVCVCVCMRLCVCACVCRRTVSTGSWEAP